MVPDQYRFHTKQTRTEYECSQHWKCSCSRMEMTYQEYLAVTQRLNAATEQFVEYVNREKRIKAVLADHVHFSFESALPGGIMQYVTGRGHLGVARESTLL